MDNRRQPGQNTPKSRISNPYLNSTLSNFTCSIRVSFLFCALDSITPLFTILFQICILFFLPSFLSFHRSFYVHCFKTHSFQPSVHLIDPLFLTFSYKKYKKIPLFHSHFPKFLQIPSLLIIINPFYFGTIFQL